MIITRPMLAATVPANLSGLRYPLLATPKIDGIRCLVVPGLVPGTTEAVSRKLKPIPNLYIRELIARLPEGFDGEIVCPGGFNETQSAVMTISGKPAFKFRVFDIAISAPYYERVGEVVRWHRVCPCPWSEALPYNQIDSEGELLEYEALCLEEGFEGVCLRTPNGPYKLGRSTFREHYLLKLKRFLDSEAVVEGFEELQHNENTQEKDELGYSKRSSAQSGLTGGGTLGALRVRDLRTGCRFSIGSGFDRDTRDKIWQSRGSFQGRVLTYKYQPYGVVDKPRIPIFKSFRLEVEEQRPEVEEQQTTQTNEDTRLS